MKRVVIAAGLLLVLWSPAWAGWVEAMAAYERGDYVTAFREMHDLARQGDVSAQSNLAFMYYQGRGVQQDHREAAKWGRQAAEQGNADAQGLMSVLYEKGNGVQQDYAEAVRWRRRAAEQGLAAAQVDLGFSYYSGKGVPQNYAEAAKWYRRAADQGIAEKRSGAWALCIISAKACRKTTYKRTCGAILQRQAYLPARAGKPRSARAISLLSE